MKKKSKKLKKIKKKVGGAVPVRWDVSKPIIFFDDNLDNFAVNPEDQKVYSEYVQNIPIIRLPEDVPPTIVADLDAGEVIKQHQEFMHKFKNLDDFDPDAYTGLCLNKKYLEKLDRVLDRDITKVLIFDWDQTLVPFEGIVGGLRNLNIESIREAMKRNSSLENLALSCSDQELAKYFFYSKSEPDRVFLLKKVFKKALEKGIKIVILTNNFSPASLLIEICQKGLLLDKKLSKNIDVFKAGPSHGISKTDFILRNITTWLSYGYGVRPSSQKSNEKSGPIRKSIRNSRKGRNKFF